MPSARRDGSRMPLRDDWRRRAAGWVGAVLAAPAADVTPALPETPAAARAGTRQVVAVFAATRAALLVVTYFGYVLVQAPKYSDTSVGMASLLTSWNRWD